MDEALEYLKAHPKVVNLPLPADVPYAINTKMWVENPDTTQVVNELASSEPTRIKEGVEIIDLSGRNNLLLRDESAANRIVSRQEQRDVIDCAFELSRDRMKSQHPAADLNAAAGRFVVAVRGSPGIGKSWSALLYLKKLLTNESHPRPVIFEFGSDPEKRTTLLLVPPGIAGNTGAEWVAYELLKGGYVGDEWFDQLQVDVIIDPAQYPSGTDPQWSILLNARGHIFIPVSPDDRHLGNLDKTASCLIELVLGPWPYKALMVAWPLMLYNVVPPDEVVNAKLKQVKKNYVLFGGLPRYLLNDEKANRRSKRMTPEVAAEHAPNLLDALTTGRIEDRKKILTLFFTIYPGSDENGLYNPRREFSTVEFVSRGALRASGQVIFEKIHSDVRWRKSSDSSSIGLAFEAVVLMFLHMGTDGMKELGISTKCRELIKDGTPSEAELQLGFCPHKSNDNTELTPVIEAADEDEFFIRVLGTGNTMKIEEPGPGTITKVSSESEVTFPPPGFANIDAMSGTSLSAQVTLQITHPPSGPAYINQRRRLGLSGHDTSVIVFVVPIERFNDGWTNFQNFRWKKDDTEEEEFDSDLQPSKKKRTRMDQGSASSAKAQGSIKAAEKAKARASLRQFVLALEIEEEKKKSKAISGLRS